MQDAASGGERSGDSGVRTCFKPSIPCDSNGGGCGNELLGSTGPNAAAMSVRAAALQLLPLLALSSRSPLESEFSVPLLIFMGSP